MKTVVLHHSALSAEIVVATLLENDAPFVPAEYKGLNSEQFGLKGCGFFCFADSFFQAADVPREVVVLPLYAL